MGRDSTEWVSLHAAVSYRDAEGVQRLLAAGASTEERNEIGATPLIVAASSDQYVIAEMLIGHGADPWAHDRFGVTAPFMATLSGAPEETPDGQARARIISSLRAAGLPWPPPHPEEVLQLVAAGRWPPRAGQGG